MMLGACRGSPAAATPPVPPSDYADAGAVFDKDEIVPSAAFTDFTAVAATDIQSFLEHDPYTGSSFLATYQSNGVLFSSAVISAAQTYRINPIVLVVAVEATGGLVADTVYPHGATSVEYVFGCGCAVPSDPTTCDTDAAGLDVQLGCYASALRASLDQIATSGATAGGWGPGMMQTSLDGLKVDPKDDSTAALYQYDPVVGAGKSGNSLFWSIWLEYTTALQYPGPAEGSTGGGTGATALTGDPCVSAADCAIADAICATGSQYPGGMCTSKCSGSCGGVDAFCADFTAGGYCLAMCNTTDSASCRPGYKCSLVMPSGADAGAAPEDVCVPM
jgi:hypothetical protein